MACAIVINKIDAENLDLPALLEGLRETFGSAVRTPTRNMARKTGRPKRMLKTGPAASTRAR